MSAILLRNHTGQLKAHLPREYDILSTFLEGVIGESMTKCRTIIEVLSMRSYSAYDRIDYLDYPLLKGSYQLQFAPTYLMLVYEAKIKSITPQKKLAQLYLEYAFFRRIIQTWLDQLEQDQLGVISGSNED